MTEFTKTQPAGRMIARLFAKVGWAIVLAGLALALAAALLGRFPGTAGGADAVTMLSRVVATLPGLGLALFGLFSVMMAAQTRAAIDSADIAREMLALARRRPISLLAAVPPLGESGEERSLAFSGAAAGDDAAGTDEVPRHAAPPRTTRFAAAPTPPPRPEPPAPPPADARKETAGKEIRAEPVFAASSRPKPAPGSKPAPGKVHPIFSARPPR